MKDVPLLDELRDTRRRLAEEMGLDAELYAAMLRGVGEHFAGEYVNEPVLPPAPFSGEDEFNALKSLLAP